jgi:hypothetical protein
MPLDAQTRALAEQQLERERDQAQRQSVRLGVFISDVRDELESAERNHDPYNSLHEAYAVILEEVDELWDLVRMKSRDRQHDCVRTELMQIAVTAIRAAKDLGYLLEQKDVDHA